MYCWAPLGLEGEKNVSRTSRKFGEHKQIVFLYGLVMLIALLPLADRGLLDKGIAKEWIARIEELSQEGVNFFPSVRVYLSSGVNDNIFGTNLFILPGSIVYGMTKSVRTAFLFTMFWIQLGSIFFSKLFFEEWFGKDDEKSVFFATMLFVISPYRMDLCYHQVNVSMALAWTLVPLYAWAFLRSFRDGKNVKVYLCSSISLALVGYADYLIFLGMIGITLCVFIYKKEPVLLCVIFLGVILLLPVECRLLQYLLKGGFEEWQLSCQSIMPKGYRFGGYFCSFAFAEGNPGIGLGMLLCLMAALWLKLVKGIKPDERTTVLLGISAVFWIMSSRRFPWEYVQRMGRPFLRLVGLWKSPVVFWGISYALLCIPAGEVIMTLSDKKYLEAEKGKIFRIIVILACLGIELYRYNELRIL